MSEDLFLHSFTYRFWHGNLVKWTQRKQHVNSGQETEVCIINLWDHNLVHFWALILDMIGLIYQVICYVVFCIIESTALLELISSNNSLLAIDRKKNPTTISGLNTHWDMM